VPNDVALPFAVTRRLPFTLHQRKGVVAVRYGPNAGPEESGFDILPGLPFDIALCRGYPTVHAAIEQYAGTGYRTVCGWVQVVSSARYAADDPQRQRGQRSVAVDVAPAMAATHMPYACVGNLPQFYDAPCRNLGPSAELRWTADTFLTTIPLRSREEAITWLAGFCWGYTEYAAPDKPVELLPLEVTGADAWNAQLSFLRAEFPEWRFAHA
jgi:hypothetical protein